MEYLLGIIVSLVTQGFKAKYESNPTKTLAVVAVGCVAIAFAYTRVVDTAYWPILVTTLTTAGAFYTFVVQRFK